MKSFAPGKAVTVNIPLVDAAGEALTPTALRSRVLDEEGTELQAWVAITVDATPQTALDINVGAGLNTLTPPATRGARVIEIEVETAGGTHIVTETFLLTGTTALAFGINTFLTFPAAVVAAADFVPMQLAGWTSVEDRAQREAALIEAHQRILQLPVGIHFNDQQSVLTQDTTFVRLFGPVLLRDLTPTQLESLDPKLMTCLKKAQLVEANEILSDDPVRRARQAGLISNTTGESSQFFRTAKPLDIPVCPRAMEYLQRWVRYGARIGRR